VAAFIPGTRNQACHSTIPPKLLWLLSFLVPGTKHATVPYHPCRCGCFHSWYHELSQPPSHTTHVTVAAIMPGARDQACHRAIPPIQLWLHSFLVPGTRPATVPYHQSSCGYIHSWCQGPSLPQYHSTHAAVAALIPGARNQACHSTLALIQQWLLSFLVPGTKHATVPYHPSCCGCFHSWCQEPSMPRCHTTHAAVAAFIHGAMN
jgi:hypothetical protein